MTRSTYSRAQRLAAVFLARESGADASAEAFGIDPRTVRKWLETVELPDDSWEAIQAVLLARGAELTAKGDNKGLVATLTGAGIASRNVRYGQLIQRREGRRAEAASVEDAHERRNRRSRIRDELIPHDDDAGYRHLVYLRNSRMAIIDRLQASKATETGETWRISDEPRAADHIGQLGLYFLLRCAADDAPDEEEKDPAADKWQPPGYEAVTTATLNAMTDDDYRAFYVGLLEAVRAEAEAWWPHYVEEHKQGAVAERGADGIITVYRDGERWGYQKRTELPPEFEGLPVVAAAPEKPALDVTPAQRIETAEPRPEEPPAPSEPMLVTIREEDHDRGWQPWVREPF